MKNTFRYILVTHILLISNLNAAAHSRDSSCTTQKFDSRSTLSFGIIQPLLGGVNVTYTQQRKHLLFAYSHGTMLNLQRLGGAFKPETARKFNIDQLTIITTGFDLGYRITPNLSLRGEWKWHIDDLEHPSGERIQYQTITIGPSLYYQMRPVKNGFLHGLTIELSGRWWPVVYSSLEDFSHDFVNAQGQVETYTHQKGHLFGAASLGWTF